MAAAEQVTVTLVSNDQTRFILPRAVAVLSVTIAHLLVDVDESDTGVIPVPSVDGSTLKLVVDFLNHQFRDTPAARPAGENANANADANGVELTEWEGAFINLNRPNGEPDMHMLFKLTLAANFLDIPRLLAVCCKKAAMLVKERHSDEVALLRLFGQTESITEEERAYVRTQHPWCNDRA